MAAARGLPRDALGQAEAAWADGRAAEAATLFGAAIAAARDSGDVPAWTRAVLGAAATQRFGPHPGRLPALLAEALTVQPDAAGRARLSAALARSWVYAGAAERGARFAAQALEQARRDGDPALLADALDASLASHWGPSELARRRELAAELDEVAAHLLAVGARLQAHLWAFTVAFENLDVLALNRAARALDLLGEESSKARFFAASRRLALDLMRGRTDTAPALLARAGEAAAEARLPDAPTVIPALHAYVALHAREAAGCAEAAAMAEGMADTEGMSTIAAEAAPFWVAAGRPERARALVRRFGGAALAALPRDVDWLLVLQSLLDAALDAGDTESVGPLAGELSGYPGRAVVNAGGFMFHGVTDDPLGRAAAARGDAETAERLRASAFDRYERAGAHWWFERLAARSGARPVARDAGSPVARPAVFRRAGDGWEVGAGDRASRLPGLRGLGHLHALVSRPGIELAALDLVGAQAGGVLLEPGLGPALDAVAARAYRERLRELDGELAEAEEWADNGRVAGLRAERAALVGELSAAFGLGSARPVGSSAERARVAVRKAITAALARLDEAEPAVAAHLRAHVHTGMGCAYRPEAGEEWSWRLG